MNKNTRRFLLWFLVIWGAINLFFRPSSSQEQSMFAFATTQTEYAQGDKVELVVENKFPYALTYQVECPGEPFTVLRVEGTTETPITATADETQCSVDTGTIGPKENKTVSYGVWNRELFWDLGTYKIQGVFHREAGTDLPVTTDVGPTPEPAQEQYTFTTMFTVAERGWFSMIAQEIFYRPIYNFLIFLMADLPGHNLGIAIIILTIVIRLALFIPTLHMLKSQRALQELQPKIQALRERYKDDKQQLAQETMRLYKEHGVNPLGSCLPLLIQMPFLFAVFFVLRNGVDPSTMYLLYEPLKGFDLGAVSTAFLTFDMTLPEPLMSAACGGGIGCFNLKSLVAPILVGGLQGLSSWLTIRRNKKNQTAAPKPAAGDAAAMQQRTMNIMMTYIFPLMIAWFSFLYPAGLSLYWAATTLFSIGQQLYLERRRQAAVPVREGRELVQR